MEKDWAEKMYEGIPPDTLLHEFVDPSEKETPGNPAKKKPGMPHQEAVYDEKLSWEDNLKRARAARGE